MLEREAKSEQGRKPGRGRIHTTGHMDLGDQLLACRAFPVQERGSCALACSKPITMVEDYSQGY